MNDFDLLKHHTIIAGDKAASLRRDGVDTMTKPDGSPVTHIDLAVDAYFKEALFAATPSYGWISEESDTILAQKPSDKYWLIDPIDGTKALVDDIPEWTISAALVENHTPVAACVYNPSTKECFTAKKGHGAFLNDVPMHTTQRTQIKGAKILTSKGHAKAALSKDIAILINRQWVHSIAYRLALVASGQADSTISLTPKSEWDIAAGQLLIEEAGGIITTVEGASLRYIAKPYLFPNLLASGKNLMPALSALTKQIKTSGQTKDQS